MLHQALCMISNPVVNSEWYAVQKCSIWVKIGDFLSCVTLEFDGWPWKTIGHLFYATSSFVNHFKAISEFKLKWESGNAQFGSKLAIFVPCDLEIRWMTSKDNWAPLLCYSKIWASFQSHLWIQTGVTVQKSQFGSKSITFLHCDLEIWQMTLKNNRASLLCYFKLYASFLCHLWIRIGDTVRKRSIWVEIGDFFSCVTLKFNRWPQKTMGHLS